MSPASGAGPFRARDLPGGHNDVSPTAGDLTPSGPSTPRTDPDGPDARPVSVTPSPAPAAFAHDPLAPAAPGDAGRDAGATARLPVAPPLPEGDLLDSIYHAAGSLRYFGNIARSGTTQRARTNALVALRADAERLIQLVHNLPEAQW